MPKPRTVEQSYLAKVTQQFDSQIRIFAKKLDKERIPYVVFGGMDAANLALSSKLIFEAKHSMSSISSADIAKEWRDWMQTTDGMAISITEAAFLLSFSILGSYYEDDDPNPFKSTVAYLWPFLRDAIKALKWGYKGVRNWLQIAMRGLDMDLRFLLLPLGVSLGVLAVLNRFWQRWMKKERKAMMKSNAHLYEEILAKGSAFHSLSAMPPSQKTKYAHSYKHIDKIFVNSYIFIDGEAKKCGLVTQAPHTKLEEFVATLPADYDAFYINSGTSVYYVDKITRQITLVCDDATKVNTFITQLEPSAQCKALTATQLETIHKAVGHRHVINKQQLFYVDDKGEHQLIALTETELIAFRSDCARELDENLIRVLEKKLPAAEDRPCRLRFVSKLSDSIPECYWNHYLYIENDEHVQQKLVFINDKGVLQEVPLEVHEQFEKDYRAAEQNKNLTGLSSEQIQNLLNKHTNKPVGLNFENWREYKNKTKKKIKTQKGTLPLRCYLSAGFAAFTDGIYFHGGALSIAVFNPHLFIIMVACSAVLTFLLLISRLYEEFDFQRKLNVTATKVKLALCVKEIDSLLTELGQISDLLAHPQKAVKVAEADVLLARQKALNKRFKVLLKKDYQKYQRRLRQQTIHSYFTATLEGLKNGLAVQSALASFMYAMATLLILLCAMSCPPLFVLSCTLIGMSLLVGFIAHSISVHHQHIKKITPQLSTSGFNHVSILNQLKAKKEASFAEVKTSIWDDSIDPSPQFIIVEWCEVVRLLFSGAVKGEKGVGDIASEKSSAVFILMAASSVVTAIFYSLRALAKGLGADPVDVAPSKSASFKFRHYKPPSGSSQSRQPRDQRIGMHAQGSFHDRTPTNSPNRLQLLYPPVSSSDSLSDYSSLVHREGSASC